MRIPLLTPAGEKLQDAKILDAIVTAIENSTGSFILMSTLILAPTMLVLWGWTGSMVAPAIVLALFGGFLIAPATGATATIGTLIVVAGVVMALVAVWRDT
jgi:hypothetical protein